MSRGCDKVAQAWVRQEIAQMKVGNISFDGTRLLSYQRVIGERFPHFVLLSNGYHTATTSTHKAAAMRAAHDFDLLAILVPYPGVGTNPPRYHKENLDRLRMDLTYAQQRYDRHKCEAYQHDINTKQAALALYTEKFGLQQQEVANAV